MQLIKTFKTLPFKNIPGYYKVYQDGNKYKYVFTPIDNV